MSAGRYRVRLESRGPNDPAKRTTIRVETPAADEHEAVLNALYHLHQPVTLWRIVEVVQVPA